MTTQIQRRRGTTAQHSTFTGAEAELTVDTTKDTVVVHDGSTVGGRPLLREDQSNLPTTAPTTGIYNASGALAISTNGAGRLFVDASGNVGIGTSSSGGVLRVFGATGKLIIGDSNFNYFDANTQIFRDSSANERMRLDSSGRLGVGTSNPQAKLDVASTHAYGITAQDVIRITPDFSGGSPFSASSMGSIIWGYNDGTTNLGRINVVANQPGTTNASSMQFWIHNGSSFAQAATLTPTGLGIGTSSPTQALSIGGSGGTLSGTAAVTLFDNNSNGSRRWSISNGAGGNTVDLIGKLVFSYGNGSSTADPMAGIAAAVIDSSGRVGIGTTSASSLLHCSTSGTTVTAQFSETSKSTLKIWHPSAGQCGLLADGANQELVFGTNNAERFRCDASGRLLVGTSSARAVASQPWGTQLEGTDYANSGLAITMNRNDFDSTYLAFGKSRGTAAGSVAAVQAGDNLGGILFAGADGSSLNSQAAIIRCQVDGTPAANAVPGRLVFSTTPDSSSSPVERLRLNSKGEFLNFSTGDCIFAGTSQGAGTTFTTFVGVYDRASTVTGGTISFRVYSNGNVQNTNNSYGAISDLKLKENIVDANSQWSDIKALQVRNYNFKEGQTHTQIGLVAQEVELVSPGLVTESPDRDAEGNDLGTVTKSVNYSVLYMKAVKALQEAMERIEQLEQRLAAAGI